MQERDRERARANGEIAGAELVKAVGQGAGLFRREERVEGGALGGGEAGGGVEGEEIGDGGLRIADCGLGGVVAGSPGFSRFGTGSISRPGRAPGTA